MKTLFTLLFVSLLSISSWAQPKQDMQRMHKKQSNLTAEQKAELMTKQMTLKLDLTDSQAKQIQTLYSSNFTKTEQKRNEMKSKKDAKEKLTEEEKHALKLERLDHQIDMKRNMKSILNADQYEQWTTMQNERQQRRPKQRQRQRQRRQ